MRLRLLNRLSGLAYKEAASLLLSNQAGICARAESIEPSRWPEIEAPGSFSPLG